MSVKKNKGSAKKKSTKGFFSGLSSSSKQSWPKRVLMWGLMLILFGLFLLLTLFGLVYVGTFGQLPDSNTLIKIKEPAASEVYSKDNKLLGRYYTENRSNVTFKEISPNMINALIATEDNRFYEHRGIDEWALVRVVVKTIFLVDRSSGGGSTLSQQIVKNIFGRKNYGPLTLPVSKIRESIIAYRLEKLYSKEEILTLYLNTVPFGENTFGIELAAERFFSVRPDKLTVPQAATLVGMLKANNSYNPRTNPERSLQRRNTVISQMTKYNYITAAQAKLYTNTPLGLKYNYLVYNTGPGAYFRELIRPQLEDWCSENTKADGTPYNLYTDGLHIVTTIDFKMQRYAEMAMQEKMKELQATFEKHWGGKDPWGKNNAVVLRAMKRSERYRKMKETGKSAAEITAEFNKPLNMKIFSWEGEKQVKISPLDSVKYALKLLHCGFVAIEPKSGDIKAWIGGNDFRYFQYDHVLAPRQVGSTFKPIIYASAIENGISPDKYYPNEKIVYSDYQDWSPGNSNEEYGGYYSLEGALCKSVNTVSVQVLMEGGIPHAIALAHKMGITADLPEVPSLALGSADIPLLQLAQAYACLDNLGKTVSPNYLIRIEDANGKLLKKYIPDNDEQEAMSPETAKIITHYLQSVVNEGTGSEIRSLYKIEGAFAGKTGTTQNFADGWFMGYTPDLVTGCWVGGEEPTIHFRNIALGRGGYMALPVVGKFFNKLYRDPAFTDYKNHYFPSLDEATLAMLDIPHFTEVNNEKGLSNLWGIFGGDPKKREERRAARLEKRKEADLQSGEKKEKPTKEEPKPGIWNKIKDALKRKD
ncbi:MAG: transglycosylase domain-containing protein [Bacteroidia bacterium]|nr:transglycosylase domain-containing protein [Bacteroidia bacterium]